jgi:hypothetical protein
MRKFTVLLLCVLAFGAFASAQMEPQPLVVPKTELFVGYAYQHADTSGISAQSSGLTDVSSTNLNGFAFEFSHYTHSNFGFTFDMTHTSNSAVDSTGIKDSRSSYLVGPSYRFHNFSVLTPSVHVLGGLDHDTFTLPEVGTVIKIGNTDAAAAAGVTFDGNLSRHLAVRLAQVDYVYTHHYGTNQSSFRYTGGVVFRF